MHEQLLARDLQRLLQLLQEGGPKTAHELQRGLRLRTSRIICLLQQLEKQGLVHSPRCTVGRKGNIINLWESTNKDP